MDRHYKNYNNCSHKCKINTPMSLPIIDKNILEFPDPNLALREPDGLLAMGGDLSTARLLQSYSQGIFPWFNAGDPILWWSPDPRAVLFPEELSINRSLKRVLKKQPFEFHINRDFEAVIQACAAPRDDTDESWITQEMKDAYIALHQLGHAHSYECWQNGKLAGGLYGVRIGQAIPQRNQRFATAVQPHGHMPNRVPRCVHHG